MTSPVPFEIEEDEPVALTVAGSHLVNTKCCVCRAPALSDPSQAEKARCTNCLGQGVTPLPGEVPWMPARGYPSPGLGPRRIEDVERSEHPEPVEVGDWITLDDAREQGFPKSALDLAWFAIGCHWGVRLRRAVGTFQDARGKAGAEQESIAVSFSGWDGYRAVAVYVKRGKQTWKWETFWIWGEKLMPFGELGLEDLKDWLAAHADVAEGWFAKLERKAAEKALHAKVVACPGSPRCLLIGPVLASGKPVADVPHEHRGSGALRRMITKAAKEAGG